MKAISRQVSVPRGTLALFTAVGLLVSASGALAADTGARADTGPASMAAFARGAKEWKENCGRCHNLRSPKEFSDKNWDVIVQHMRTIAPLPGQVARDIRTFLKASN